MYRSLKDLRGHQLAAIDGEIGTVKDIYFDDAEWGVRYLVVDTGKWLPGRRVLISPASLGRPDDAADAIPVALRREQIERCPDVGTDLPVSRQREAELVGHYDWPTYWTAGAALGAAMTKTPPSHVRDLSDRLAQTAREQSGAEDDPHLRSVNEVLGYRIQAHDGEIGHVEDLLFDEEAWTVGYIIVDTRNWLPGRKVLVAPRWFNKLSWDESKFFVGLYREAVEKSPAYDPASPLEREQVERLQAHYDSPEFWATGVPMGAKT
jgi:sporulation protein YlmC with PRC-barrel domain